jgi:hypothetical protein
MQLWILFMSLKFIPFLPTLLFENNFRHPKWAHAAFWLSYKAPKNAERADFLPTLPTHKQSNYLVIF